VSVNQLGDVVATSDRSDSDGFTLVELLIVVIVLGILAAVVVFAIGSVSGNARASACANDAKTIITAVQSYNSTVAPVSIKVEATSGPGSITPGNPATYAAAGTQAAILLAGNYLNAWPSTNNGYAISLSTTKAGDVMVYVPATSATGMSYDNETTSTGCNAL
jgi:general secretion pathway protein G